MKEKIKNFRSWSSQSVNNDQFSSKFLKNLQKSSKISKTNPIVKFSISPHVSRNRKQLYSVQTLFLPPVGRTSNILRISLKSLVPFSPAIVLYMSRATPLPPLKVAQLPRIRNTFWWCIISILSGWLILPRAREREGEPNGCFYGPVSITCKGLMLWMDGGRVEGRTIAKQGSRAAAASCIILLFECGWRKMEWSVTPPNRLSGSRRSPDLFIPTRRRQRHWIVEIGTCDLHETLLISDWCHSTTGFPTLKRSMCVCVCVSVCLSLSLSLSMIYSMLCICVYIDIRVYTSYV